MKTPILAFALVLLLPATSRADIITAGVWSSAATTMVNEDLDPFWDNPSWDGADLNVGFLIGANRNASLEFLHGGLGNPVAFRFQGPVLRMERLHHITAWDSGVYGFDNELFCYDSHTGRQSNSQDSYAQYALFRIPGPETTRYYLGIEDILLSETRNDRDYNDTVLTFEVANVSEPSSLTLLLLGAMTLAGRRLLQARRHRGPTGVKH
jgi:hypothetical protein